MARHDFGFPAAVVVGLARALCVGDTAAAMRPPGDTGGARLIAGLHSAVVRLFALSLTLTLVMATFIMAIDEVAWQCGNNPICTRGHSPTKFMAWSALSSPPRRIVVLLASVCWPKSRCCGSWPAGPGKPGRRCSRSSAGVPWTTSRRPATAPASTIPRLWDDREP